ncbi:MAG: M55 family metallopeptidase [Pseudomonadota bacterium]
MKVFITADLEGVAGVVSWDQTLRDGLGYAQACQWMTSEVAAACEAAIEAGATRVLVADSHLTRENLDLDRLPEMVEVVRGGPRPLGMVQGLDTDKFDIAFCIGFHAGAQEDGILNHTCNGAGFYELRLNGEPVDELDLYIRVAGYFETPIGLVTGDRAVCLSANSRYPHIETVAVKDAIGRVSASCISPSKARDMIRDAVTDILSRDDSFDVVDGSGPYELEIDFKWHHPAECLAMLPSFERRGAHTLKFVGETILDVSKAVEFCGSYKLVPYP